MAKGVMIENILRKPAAVADTALLSETLIILGHYIMMLFPCLDLRSFPWQGYEAISTFWTEPSVCAECYFPSFSVEVKQTTPGGTLLFIKASDNKTSVVVFHCHCTQGVNSTHSFVYLLHAGLKQVSEPFDQLSEGRPLLWLPLPAVQHGLISANKEPTAEQTLCHRLFSTLERFRPMTTYMWVDVMCNRSKIFSTLEGKKQSSAAL